MRLKFHWSLLLLASVLSVLQHRTSGALQEKCSQDTFSCKTAFTQDGMHCIPKNWVCDGDNDCPDGDDEIGCENPSRCPDTQFQCPVGTSRCIALGWQCDGQKDCDDGADEDPQICRTRKKGYHLRGDQVDQFQCLPNMYRCPGTYDCINFTSLCDGLVDCPADGADEGGHCLNRACQNNAETAPCKRCKETMQGPQCYCEKDKVYNKTRSECVDINECMYDAYCDQDCTDDGPGYNCTCRDGYTHTNESGKVSKSRCYVNSTLPSPKLILANQTLIRVLNKAGDKLTPVGEIKFSTKMISSLVFDYANNSICWASYSAPLTCADATDNSKMWNISMQFSLDFIKQVAKDWVSGNWYFADEVREQIFVCTDDGKYCMALINTGISRPKSLALDPTKGYMFYTDWSTSSRIGRADLDGQNRKADLVSKKIVHPHGITLDFVRQHLYWGDSFLDFIERIDYDGNHRVTIVHGLNVLNVFSMSMLENSLYVINHHNHSIIKLHRYDHVQPPTLVSGTVGNPSVIQVFHQVRQPRLPGDICGVKNCSHFCIPVPGNGGAVAKCVCRTGFKLVNKTECQPISVPSYLLYANAQQGMIRSVAMDTDVGDVHEPIINLVRPVALAVDPRNNDVYYSDVNTRQIGHYSDATGKTTILHPGGSRAPTSEGLAVDWVGQNLYWTDNAFNCIFVASLANLSLARKVICDNVTYPKSIALDPLRGRMYWTDWVMQPSSKKAKIESALMDGSDRKVLTTDTQVQWPNSLHLDVENQRLYWTEAYYDRIQSMALNGSDHRVEVSHDHLSHPYGIVYHNGTIYWTEAIKGEIRSWNNKSANVITLRRDSKPLFDLVKVTSEQVPLDETHPCSSKNNKCDDMCIPNGPGTATCVCAMNRMLSTDSHTCSGAVEALHCPAGYFTCVSDGTCIPNAQTCNGLPTCADGSDEAVEICLDKTNKTCGEGMHKCEGTNGGCIFLQFVCDGENDCLHGSDESEENCRNHTCPANHTKCANSSRCIPNVWRCDGESDCPDGSDEGKSANCTYAECSLDQFKCTTNGRCLPNDYRCDHEYDCEDKSDEFMCDQRCDAATEFKCKNSSRCLQHIYVCDGKNDCSDGSDEQGCLVNHRGVSCSQIEFRCLSNISCIPQAAVCDGIDDCVDGSDEKDCHTTTSAPGTTKKNGTPCHWSEFMCEDGSRCIPRIWKCDRDTDCIDQSDERHCSFNQECELPNFRCKSKNSSICLPPEKMCNDVPDCPDHSDEGRLCSYNLCLNHDCSDKCNNGPDGFVCSCNENRKLMTNNKTCIDINICSQWGACSQKCNATTAGKMCSCFPGYELAPDKWTCVAVERPMVIFSRRHEIRQLSMQDKSTVSLVSGLRNTIALDFLYEEKYLFWTDVGDDKIYRGTIISNTVTDIQRIIDVGLATTEGLAVDWVGGNIYWVESNLDQIEVARLNGSNRTTLLAGNMQSPRAIVLDPRVGLLFWTDWDGENPRIERCSMSGENSTRSVIYSIRDIPNGGWPNGLTLDYEAYRLYWVDARSDSVHSSDYKGKDHRVILISHKDLSHPFSLAVFEDYIYWTDWRYNTLVKANKFNGSNVTVIQRTYTQPFDVKIFHPLRQPKVANNPCDAKTNGGCTHLCLLGNDNDQLVARCHCPHRWKLNSDKKTCTRDNTFLLYVKENEIRGVDLETAYYNVIPSITVPFVENASAIDYDSQSDRLYWTDSKRQVITSAFLNGTGVQTIIDTGLSNPEGFAIDWLSHNMYFTSYDEEKASISVSKLDGAFRTEIFTPKKTARVNSIAIHPTTGVMFWSEIGVNQHRIMRAFMDGTEPTEFVSNATNAASLTLDHKMQKLYWVSRTEQNPQVYYCNISGSTHCEATSFPGPNISDPHSITIHNKNAYYASSTKIVRINLGNNQTQELRTDTPHVSALQVYDPASRDGNNSCSEKNGGCQQLCLPRHYKRHCLCTAGFTLNPDNKTCSGVTSFLLFSTNTEIRGISLDSEGKKMKQALAPISKISLASSVNFDAKEDRIYWVDTTARTISRINRDLSQRQTIVDSGISGIESMAVDWIAGNIYWTDRGHDVIQVSKLNGSNRFVVIHDNMEKPRSIAVHPTNGYLFFSDWGAYPRIVMARLDGSKRTDLVAPSDNATRSKEMRMNNNQGIKAPYGLAVDQMENMLYWCDKDLDIIERVNLTSRERRIILSTNLTDCVSVDVYGEHIYWADQTELGGCIKRANKIDGSDIRVLKSNISKLQDIKVFHSDKQTGTNKCAVNNGGCAELCLYIGNDTVTCACSHGKLAADGQTCEDYESFLLYSKVTSIESILLAHNMTSLNPPKEPIKPENADIMQNVIGLTFDLDTKRLFFSDIQRGDIYSVYFNNTGYKRIYANVGSAEGLAYDSKNQRLYFTSYTNSSINRLDFSPQSTLTDKEPRLDILVQLDKSDHPRAIVINPCIQRIFWTNWNPNQPSIQTASYDGRKAEAIVTERIRTPNGLAIDYKARKLYWSDARLDKIERINYDGSGRVVVVQSITQHSFSLAVHGDHLYWTDWLLRAVLRANKYDGSGIRWLRKDIERQPMGIVAVAKESAICEADPCYKNRFGCEQICNVDKEGQPQCSCSKGQKLLSDDRRCVHESVKSGECTADSFVCLDKTSCVPFNTTCDGEVNCKDASDESMEYCKTRSCPSPYFQCLGKGFVDNAHLCIERSRVCDGQLDCQDGADEKDCPCKEKEFRCVSNGMCIREDLRCDHDSDCIDHSDEMDCNFNCSDLEIAGVKHEGLISCNTTSMCIYPSWICDHSNDCWDNNDEKNCNYTEEDCPKEAFRCDDGTCILQRWKCDKYSDCADGSDELTCNYTCDEDQMSCGGDSVCIPTTWKCDGHQDCTDNSDERNCSAIKCDNTTHFQCHSGRCIPKEWRCDGDSDCSDGADERVDSGCEPVKCMWDQFQCLNRRCIRSAFYCDGDDDCGDNSDEPNTCVYKACSNEEFQCSQPSHKCIPKSDRCNGFIDCPDHSDEANCTVSPCGDPNLFQCSGGSCIKSELVCNRNKDCPNGDDEPRDCDVNECKARNGDCSHTCHDQVIGYRCSCPQGYMLKSDNKTCTDIDECQTQYPCSQYCENHRRTYRCSCAENYTLGPDKSSCKATQAPRPRLLVANRYYILLVNITTGSEEEVKTNSTNAVAVDFDWHDQYIYWSDITFSSASINRKRLNDSTAPVEVLHSTTVRNPDGLAVDWVGRNLYWCDKTTDTIEVSRLNGSNRLVLVREGLQEPRGLEVFPQKGLLFYTDWGDTPHIGSVQMDGAMRKVIIDTHLAWPNALTIDYVTATLFWADGNLDYIGMAAIDGSRRRTVIGQGSLVPHVFAITTFENRLYWTDWEKDSIMYSDKFSGNHTKNLTNLAHRPMDIQVVHPLRQVEVLDAWGRRPCGLGCTHLCLLRPHKTGSVVGVCSCPENFYLSHDGVSCISNCTTSQFKCGDESKCIPRWWECDGRQDCLDKSDEHKDCEPYYCPQPGMFQCKNDSSHKCLFPYQICDGTSQCANGSDEEQCDTYHCLDHYFKCTSDNKCIPDMKKCDGTNDCTGHEDESACVNVTCSANQFKCDNNRCVPYVWRCDKDNDCEDNSDETGDCLSQTCKPGHFKCTTSGRCIPEAWKCDGDKDCGEGDDSDEDSDDCSSKTCDPTYFKCDNGHCIPGRWKCDFYDDCKDGSDEKECSPQNCTTVEFQCASGRCVSKKMVCDGNDNCGDHSDEIHCNVTCKSNSEFTCNNSNHCVPKAWKCDGDTDCSDGSDEWNCNRTCSPGEFQCNNSICQPLLWRCDGDHDCGDNSDEDPKMCAMYACAPGRFRCNNHICIWNSMVCDGNKDCSEGEDEAVEVCPEKCLYPNFSCLGSSLCLVPGKVCNGIIDCAFANSTDRSDEDPMFCNLTRGMSCDNHTTNNCEHFCHQYKDQPGIRCSCDDGFELNENGYSCDEVNPCDILGSCSQGCEYNKTKQYHTCSCEKGFKQHLHQCYLHGTKEEDWPTLLIGEEGKVDQRRLRTDKALSLNGSATQGVLDVKSHIISMDVDVNKNLAFIVAFANSTWEIRKQEFHASLNTRRRRDAVDRIPPTVISHSSTEIRALAVDWIGERIYVTDATTREVRIMNYDGERSKHVVDGITSPQAVAVDAVNSKLYWTDRGPRPSISQSNLDGSERRVLVEKDIVWPHDLAVDVPNKRLYWVDSKLRTVETITTAGKDRRVLWRFDGPPTAVDVFGDVVYTVQGGTIYQMTKYRASVKPDIIYEIEDQKGVIVVAHKLKQKTEDVNNSCNKDSNPCMSNTQLCFNLPGDNKTCVCPDNSRLDGKKCQFFRCHCLNGGTCNDTKGGQQCQCPKDYSGAHCEKWVCTNYCQHAGFCHISDSGDPSCICRPPFSGKHCEKAVEDCNGKFSCYNGGTCVQEASGFLTCHCANGFTGARCQHCQEHKCFNGGVCSRQDWYTQCHCTDGFDPITNCAERCNVTCVKDGDFRRQHIYSGTGSCKCDCPPSYTLADCGTNPCKGYCQNEGVCSVDHRTKKPECQCPHIFFEGKQCETCKCQPGGECTPNDSGVVTQCTCHSNYTGDMCQTLLLTGETLHQTGMSIMETMLLSGGITIVIIIIAIIIAVFYFRRKRRQEQYHHKRMQDGGELNVTNPVYMRKDPGDDDDEDDEEEPLGASLIFTGNASTNFANPMYDVYNPNTSESTQRLLSGGNVNEERELLENNMPVRYFGSNEGGESQKFSVA
ncbi:low-density lipoprotein receptor-related protein 1-like [Littorina saxatilis]|uniref:low-density lipoprotein receptor-related protein 1-like n=1 Tax=Littorina saxatilis TaxID=31220 RepID=UPI0038B51F93